MDDIATPELGDFLDRLGSTDPAPGSGAAAAVALALGTSCALKAVRITRKHHPDDASLATAEQGLAAIARQALAGGSADAAHFPALIAAMQLPHDTPEEAEARDRAVADAAGLLVALAKRLLALGAEASRLVAEVAPRIQPNMANDVAAARALIDAAATIQRANAAENRALR